MQLADVFKMGGALGIGISLQKVQVLRDELGKCLRADSKWSPHSIFICLSYDDSIIISICHQT